MAQPNSLNPEFLGLVSAGGFRSGGSEAANVCSVVGVATTGTVYKDILRKPIGYDIKVVSAWAITTGLTNTVVSVVGTGGTIVAITTTGAATTTYGTFCTSSSALTNTMIGAAGTIQVVSTSTTDQTVVFIVYKYTKP